MIRKIMLVDDVEISNFITMKMIEKVCGDACVSVFTLPAKAYQSLPDVQPDIIFLDLNMPVIDGWKFLDMMHDTRKTTPVYILTSSTSELDLQRSKKYENVQELLIKPLTTDLLRDIFINRHQPAKAELLSANASTGGYQYL